VAFAIVDHFIKLVADRPTEDTLGAIAFPDCFEAVLNDILSFGDVAPIGRIGDRARFGEGAVSGEFCT